MEINNYYSLLGLKYKFTPLRLLWNYLKNSKKVLNTKTYSDFIALRQGFEVLRKEESLDCYNKIYRKYILKRDLNYPERKEKEMIKTFQDQEQKARQIAEKITSRQDSYLQHLLGIISEILIKDISMIFVFGRSGVLFIVVGLYCIIAFHNETNIIGGITVIVIGLFFFRSNLNNYISDN